MSALHADILTIMRKEWREILNASGSGSSTRTNVAVGTAMLIFCVGLAASPPAVEAPGLTVSGYSCWVS